MSSDPPALASPEQTGPARAGEKWERIGFWGYALHLYTIFGIALSNITLGFTLLVAPRALAGRMARWRRLLPVVPAAVTYLLLLCGSVLTSNEPRVSLRSLGEVFAFATLALAPGLIPGEAQLRRLVDGVQVVAALLAVKGLSAYLVGQGELDVGKRIRGPFSHYMTFSGVLLICDVLVLTSLLGGRRQAWRWAALVLINLALLGTLTRGAWVALALTIACLLVVCRPRLLLAAVPAAVLFAALAPVAVLHRALSIANVRDASNYDRLCMIEAGLRMTAERPLLGQGPDMVDHRYAIYRHTTAPRYWVPHLHNSFLELSAERGLPALASYFWLMAVPLRLAARRYREEGSLSGPRADLYLGTLFSLLAFNLAGLFENNWGDAEVKRYALFVLALPLCLESPVPAAGDAVKPAAAG